MIRRTPAFPRPALVFAFLGLASIGLLIHACTEPNEPAIRKDITGPQLANNTASCDVSNPAPCLEVQVTLNAPGKPPAKGIVVTALVGGSTSAGGPFSEHSGKAFHAKTNDIDGIAKISLESLGLETGEQVGVCLIARSFTNTDDVNPKVLLNTDPFTQAEYVVVPNQTPPSAMKEYQGAVTVANNSKPLTKENFWDGCVAWTDIKKAPLTVDNATAAKVSMSMNQLGATITNSCYNLSGQGPESSQPPENCPTWAAILFDKPVPWAPDLPGVEQGLIVAGGGQKTNPAELKGLVCDREYAIETAEDAVTYSTKVTACSDGDPTAITAAYNPTLCIINQDPPEDVISECSLAVTEGIDFLCNNDFPIRDGVLAADPLSTVLFEPSRTQFAIYYDQIYRDGSGEVTLHLRARNDMLSPSTLNHVATYDFSSCPDGAPIPVDESGSLTVVVSCRRTHPDDLSDLTTRVFWLITVPDQDRMLEYRLDSAFDTYPIPSRSGDDITRSMHEILLTGLTDYCPLEHSGFGKSNDPKVWGSTLTGE